MPDLYSDNWSDESKSGVTLRDLKGRIATSINAVKEKIKNEELDILDFTTLKFEKIAVWPYPVEKDKKKNKSAEEACNFIEFVNQLFTTVASVKAIEYLQAIGANVEKWKMCLGTSKGRDLTVYDERGERAIIAEIFAVTDPCSNLKLKEEIVSLVTPKKDEIEKTINNRYAFFILAKNRFSELKSKAHSWTSRKDGRIAYNKDSLKIPKENNRPATWTCKCFDKDINIVCWSSEGCLEDFNVSRT